MYYQKMKLGISMMMAKEMSFLQGNIIPLLRQVVLPPLVFPKRMKAD